MRKILAASRNRGKIEEIKILLSGMEIELLSLSDVPLTDDVIEDGESYEENALKKAAAAAKKSGLISISDDSGLEVDALDGRPGIHSARFAGEGLTDGERNIKLLDLLKKAGKEKSSARYVCVVYVVNPVNGENCFFRGECKGEIIIEPKGETGFGYDPIFFLPEYGQTFAELGSEIKNKISHRARAFSGVKRYLEK